MKEVESLQRCVGRAQARMLVIFFVLCAALHCLLHTGFGLRMQGKKSWGEFMAPIPTTLPPIAAPVPAFVTHAHDHPSAQRAQRPHPGRMLQFSASLILCMRAKVNGLRSPHQLTAVTGRRSTANSSSVDHELVVKCQRATTIFSIPWAVDPPGVAFFPLIDVVLSLRLQRFLTYPCQRAPSRPLSKAHGTTRTARRTRRTMLCIVRLTDTYLRVFC